MPVTLAPSFHRISAAELRRVLDGPAPPLVLDIRRTGAFLERPEKIPGAVPLALDREPPRIPNERRERPVVAYCLCSGATSSSRVARWLLQEGYENVSVLIGGLQAWVAAGYDLMALDLERDVEAVSWKPYELLVLPEVPKLALDAVFLPRVAGQSFLDGRELPTKRPMVAVFVDMVDSTELVLHRTPEEVLEVIQTFMEVVIDVGAYHCGDVHDFEGDGAFLYFEGVGEALPAAFRLRDALLERRRSYADLPLPRISLDAGPLVIGLVGTRFRQTVALVGAAVHRAARILKLAPPGGIVATQSVLDQARETDPTLTRRFIPLEEEFVLDPTHPKPAPLWVSPHPEADLRPRRPTIEG